MLLHTSKDSITLAMASTTCIPECPDGYFNNFGTCSVCTDTSCAKCSSTECLECLPNSDPATNGLPLKYFHASARNCVDSCPVGTVNSGGKCVDCLVSGCKFIIFLFLAYFKGNSCTLLNLSGCLGCSPGSILSADKKSCISGSTCPEGSFIVPPSNSECKYCV